MLPKLTGALARSALGSLVIIGLCLLPEQAQAVVTTKLLISEVNVGHSGDFWFRTTGGTLLCELGEANGNNDVGVVNTATGASAQGVSMLLSVVLAAYLSGRQINVNAEDLPGWGCQVVEVKLR
jgi:hypothetical protein